YSFGSDSFFLKIASLAETPRSASRKNFPRAGNIPDHPAPWDYSRCTKLPNGRPSKANRHFEIPSSPLLASATSRVRFDLSSCLAAVACCFPARETSALYSEWKQLHRTRRFCFPPTSTHRSRPCDTRLCRKMDRQSRKFDRARIPEPVSRACSLANSATCSLRLNGCRCRAQTLSRRSLRASFAKISRAFQCRSSPDPMTVLCAARPRFHTTPTSIDPVKRDRHRCRRVVRCRLSSNPMELTRCNCSTSSRRFGYRDRRPASHLRG